MEEERICALCEEALSEEDEGHVLKDGRLVCDDCFEYSCAPCDDCGEYMAEDDLTFWGDDYRLCPDCYQVYFPPYDEAKNLEETKEAYDAMLKRLLGKKTDREDDYIEIETDMNEDSFKYEISVTTDENCRICDISRLSITRCSMMSERREEWEDYPVSPSDYDEDGLAENLILGELEIIDEEDEENEEV